MGTGFLRGMPILGALSLSSAGFSIWPFDPLRLPAVVEIYPRALTGRVVKSDVGARHRYLEARHPDLDPILHERAASSEDAFDAAVSALVMAGRVDEILALPPARDEMERLEGRIWIPRPEGAASPLSQG